MALSLRPVFEQSKKLLVVQIGDGETLVPDMLIAYAAKAGSTASDDDGAA
jgi:hypothetical protein